MKSGPMQKPVTGFVRGSRANSSAGRDCVLLLQEPSHKDRLDSARRIENRAAEVSRTKIFVDQAVLNCFSTKRSIFIGAALRKKKD